MSFYTPGHGLITDTLIMHGLIRILAGNGVTLGTVRREGFRYVIEFNGTNLSKELDFLETLKRETELYLNFLEKSQNVKSDYENTSRKLRIAYKYLKKLDAANIDQNNLNHLLKKLNEKLASLDLETFKRLDHKDEAQEGRAKSKSLITLYLPLSFVYGKYYQKDRVLYDKFYLVCPNCFITSTLGLLFGTAVVNFREGDKKVVYLVTLAPTNEMRIVDVLLLQRLLEKKPIEINVEINVLASILYVLSLGETVYALKNTDFEAIAWKLVRSGNFQRAEKHETVNVGDLLGKIARIKLDFPEFPRFINECLLRDQDGAIILNELAFYLTFGGDKYSVMRRVARFVTEMFKKGRTACRYDISQLERGIS
ncbi:hypothetical protein [Infirmifilum sp.]|uniref:hypothetical protein n=1 Tax=Infirmifilum sp. TaxID=2856575 RepID=UPI003D0BC1ED